MTFEELEHQVAGLKPHLDDQGQLLMNLFMPFCKHLGEENLVLRPENISS
jgi:hypothetical protein